jgi:hypothetical protein
LVVVLHSTIIITDEGTEQEDDEDDASLTSIVCPFYSPSLA